GTQVETRGNVSQVGLRRVRELDVRFPASVGADKLADRVVHVDLQGGKAIAGVITSVEVAQDGELVARVRVEIDGDDPFARAAPQRVRVEIGRSTPIEQWVPELARLDWPYRERGP